MNRTVDARTPNPCAAAERPAGRRRARIRRIASWVSGAFISLWVSAAWAQGAGGASGGRFKPAPSSAAGDAAGGGGDGMILGLVSANTLFFITAGLIALFWFTVGGGRRPQVGRRGH